MPTPSRNLTLTLAASFAVYAALWASSGSAEVQQTCRTFAETGHKVCGRFLEYWQNNGELAQHGYPISEPFVEVSETDGRTYTVQYFERAVFELHPQNKPPYDVLLSLLGTSRLKQRYPGGQVPAPLFMPGEKVRFATTGKTISGQFLAYWRTHGGLSQQGYPLTEPFLERGAENGNEYLVQYFERAIFEAHPANRPPFDVLLTRLGAQVYAMKHPSPAMTPASDPFSALHARALAIPTATNGTCPRSTGGVVAPEFGAALGTGPVYPVGLGDNGFLNLDATSMENGWSYSKVLWIAAPAYQGPTLVRGRQIGGPFEVRFSSGPNPASELRLAAASALITESGWRHWPTQMRLTGPGCYGLQMDGDGFSRVLVFFANDTR